MTKYYRGRPLRDVTDTHARCSICKEMLPHEDFGKCRAINHGITSACKKCSKARAEAKAEAIKASITPEQAMDDLLFNLGPSRTAKRIVETENKLNILKRLMAEKYPAFVGGKND